VCDTLCARGVATATGTAVFAKNSDRPPGEAQELEWFAARRDEGPVRATHVPVEAAPGETLAFLGSRPWWMWGVEHGVNEAGLAAGNELVITRADPTGEPPGLIGCDLVRVALERATTAAEAVEVVTTLVERYGQGGTGYHGEEHPYWSSFLFADPARAFVLETSGRVWAADEVDRTRAITNRTTIPDFDREHHDPSIPTDLVADPRLAASRAVLAREPVGVDALVAHLRSHEGPDGWSVCMHVPGFAATTAAMVAELPAAGGGRPRVWAALGSPCRSVFVPLWVGRPLGEPVEWARFAALGDEHRAALDALEAALWADAADDDGWGPEAWRRVDAALRDLGAPVAS
jgi:secernin